MASMAAAMALLSAVLAGCWTVGSAFMVQLPPTIAFTRLGSSEILRDLLLWTSGDSQTSLELNVRVSVLRANVPCFMQASVTHGSSPASSIFPTELLDTGNPVGGLASITKPLKWTAPRPGTARLHARMFCERAASRTLHWLPIVWQKVSLDIPVTQVADEGATDMRVLDTQSGQERVVEVIVVASTSMVVDIVPGGASRAHGHARSSDSSSSSRSSSKNAINGSAWAAWGALEHTHLAGAHAAWMQSGATAPAAPVPTGAESTVLAHGSSSSFAQSNATQHRRLCYWGADTLDGIRTGWAARAAELVSGRAASVSKHWRSQRTVTAFDSTPGLRDADSDVQWSASFLLASDTGSMGAGSVLESLRPAVEVFRVAEMLAQVTGPKLGPTPTSIVQDYARLLVIIAPFVVARIPQEILDLAVPILYRSHNITGAQRADVVLAQWRAMEPRMPAIDEAVLAAMCEWVKTPRQPSAAGVGWQPGDAIVSAIQSQCVRELQRDQSLGARAKSLAALGVTADALASSTLWLRSHVAWLARNSLFMTLSLQGCDVVITAASSSRDDVTMSAHAAAAGVAAHVIEVAGVTNEVDCHGARSATLVTAQSAYARDSYLAECAPDRIPFCRAGRSPFGWPGLDSMQLARAARSLSIQTAAGYRATRPMPKPEESRLFEFCGESRSGEQLPVVAMPLGIAEPSASQSSLVEVPGWWPDSPTAGRVFTLGYMGRLSAEKSVGVLLRVAAETQRVLLGESLEEPVRLRVALVGHGAIRSELTRLAAHLQMAPESVLLTGALRGDVLRSALRRMDAVFFSTLRPEAETFGLVAAEAMGAGIPLVTFGAGGSSEFSINGTTALVLSTAEPRLAAQELAAFIRDDQRRSAVQHTAQSLAISHLTARSSGGRYYDLLTCILARCPRSGYSALAMIELQSLQAPSDLVTADARRHRECALQCATGM